MSQLQYQNRRKRKSSSFGNFWKLLIWGSILGGIIWGGSEWNYRTDLSASVSEISQPTEVEISGSVSSIAEYLKEKNLIVSASSFVKYVKKEHLDTKIQAGGNIISPHMTIPQIAQKLLKAEVNTITVRIPEGYTLEEVDRYLSEKNILEKNEFLECVEKSCDFSQFAFLPKDRKKWEGYFFPDTYEFKRGEVSAKALTEEMLKEFQINAQSTGAFDSDKSLENLVIMASMIEKESSTYEGNESAMIADVLWKRIEEGIPLGVDATIRYILHIKSNALTVHDLNKNNPFNTRKNRGLPPHAISNFSAHSLKAAVSPQSNQFYYYLHSDGKIHFGKTNAEHEQNKQKYCGGSCE